MAETGTALVAQDPDSLVTEIERTRDNLARTIDAIADRVSPQKNLSRALEQVRQRASRVDPLIVGAAAGAVLVSVTVVFLVRRRKR